MTDEASAATRRPKGRSPLYPSINLETAIQRARQLHSKERLHPTNVTTIAVEHWGYKSLNGPAAQALAALKKYGLIHDEGAGVSRKARLTDLADVILVHPDEAMRKSAIREAALKPTMHRELWDKYQEDLPSDSNLRWELTHDRGFTETGASEFIPVYRATVAFAQLASVTRPGDGTQDDAGAKDDDQDDNDDDYARDNLSHDAGKVDDRRPLRASVKSYAVPLIDHGTVKLEGEFPISERDWQQLLAVITAMKPGLVASDEGSD